MADILEALNLDIEEVLDDLRLHWHEHSMFDYNSTAFSKISKKGSNIMFCCSHHHETNPSCGIQVNYPYTWNCFGCGATGNLYSLVAHALELPTPVHGEHYLTRNYLVVDVKERPVLDLESILDGRDSKVAARVTEEEIQRLCSKRHSYIKERGFIDRTLKTYEIGYDEDIRAITFPVRTTEGTARFIKRRLVDSKRFLNETDVAKKDIVYGLYYILQAGIKPTELYLNESETDTMASYQGGFLAGAILGRILFKEQIKELLKSGVRTVNLFFDNDLAGVECTLKSYQSLSKTPIHVNVVKYPGLRYGIDTTDVELIAYKDANDLLKAGTIKGIETIPYMDYLLELEKSKLINVDELLKTDIKRAKEK